MKKQKWLNVVYKLLASLFLAGEIAVAADISAVLMGSCLPVSVFVAMIVTVVSISFLLRSMTAKKVFAVASGILATVVLVSGTLILCWQNFAKNAAYQSVDSGKEQLYANRNVMVLVPHQDDELNILGGAMEEFVRYGSQIHVVFSTNGDFENLSQTRFREALDVCRRIGIPEENVIFLGYGDTWDESGVHLYNAPSGKIMTSFNGMTQTYGTTVKNVYREGRDYTVDNFLEDLETVILEKRPDVIFCNDYDRHIDHKALSLAFEKVMGKVLKENSGYRPLVFKGYAYMSAWYAPYDFYGENLASTLNVYESPNYQFPRNYRWEDRLRLPVDASGLSRSMVKSGAFEILGLYASQEATFHAPGIINGDKIFWYRDTNSLCLDAKITVSSSDGSLLQDFMLLEHKALVDKDALPYDGVWTPAQEDSEKSAAIIFDQPQTIHNIVLYDHPSEEDNVLNARIVFADGTEIQTGPLHTGGAATVIPVGKKKISSFTVYLDAAEGENAGLSEIEAFRGPSAMNMKLLKTVDQAGNFVYDYWVSETGAETFGFYTWGDVPAVTEDNYTVACDNSVCNVVLESGKLQVNCPIGEAAVITISSRDGHLSDSIYVRNPNAWTRLQNNVCQKLEATLFVGYCEGRHWQLATVKLLDLAGKILGIR